MKEFVQQITKALFNKTDEETAALLFDKADDSDELVLKSDAAKIILDLDKDRVKDFKTKQTENFDKGYQKAEKKFKTAAEDIFIKTTGYKPDEDGEALEVMITNHVAKVAKVKKPEITDDDIKKHPVFLALESNTISKEDHETLQADFNNFKLNQETQLVLGKVKEKAWGVVSALKPIMSENQTVAATRQGDFLSKFNNFNYQVDNGKILILDKDNKRVEDEHGNHIPFDTFVSNLAKQNFDFKKQDKKGNAGNTDTGDVVVVDDKPVTKHELNKALDKYEGPGEENAKKRIAVVKYYSENKED